MINQLRNKEYFAHMEVLPQYTPWFLSMTYRFPDYQIGKNVTFLQDRNLGDLKRKRNMSTFISININDSEIIDKSPGSFNLSSNCVLIIV